MGTKTVREVIYNGAGQVIQTIDHTIATKRRDVSKAEFLTLLPAATVKAVKESTVAAIVAKYESFKLEPVISPTYADAMVATLVGATLMTQGQADAIVWPEE